MIERSRVQVLAGAVGDFSSPEVIFCADWYSLSAAPACYFSGAQKDPGHSARSASGRLHLNTYTHDPAIGVG